MDLLKLLSGGNKEQDNPRQTRNEILQGLLKTATGTHNLDEKKSVDRPSLLLGGKKQESTNVYYPPLPDDGASQRAMQEARDAHTQFVQTVETMQHQQQMSQFMHDTAAATTPPPQPPTF